MLKKLLLTTIVTSLLSYGTLFSQSDSPNNYNQKIQSSISNIYSNNSMSKIQECFDKARKIKYVFDVEKIDGVITTSLAEYWQNPDETDSLKTGDCEDQSIYLQKLLRNINIPSELVFGKYNINSPNYHVWLELDKNDTTYILDPAMYGEIVYRDSPGIVGNISKDQYKLSLDLHTLDFVDYLVDKYQSRNPNHDKLFFKNHRIKTYPPINMTLVRELFETSKKFKYERESWYSPDLDYWKTPLETQTTLSGDCEDKSIHLNDRLKSNEIYSELVDGKYDKDDGGFHIWLELESNDTTYLLDPTNIQIFYRTSKGIKGNVPKKKYIIYPLREYIKLKIIEYHMRNDVKLRFKNK